MIEIHSYTRRAEVNKESVISSPLAKQRAVFAGLMADIYFPERDQDNLSMKKAQEVDGDFMGMVFTRNERAKEVRMEEVVEAAKIANGLYTCPVFQTLCIDGRVEPVLVGGFSAGIGGAIRTPAGDLKEVVRDRRGGTKIIEGSYIDKMLEEAFQKNDEINELLDSHVECAAKKTGEQQRGRIPTDAGLLEDVKRKKAIAAAMKKHVESKYQGAKKVNPIQFSFDPHNGYGYMGLETDDAMQKAEKMGGFDPDTLETLVLDGKVLSTQALSYDTLIKKAFEQRFFIPDWKEEYPETAYQFWTNIQEMQGQLLPYIQEKIQSLYNGSISNNEIHDRALLLLSNAYSGFLHNYEQQYSYKDHTEMGVNINVGMYGPHKGSLFAVNDGDIDNLPGNTDFAAGIVRANRRAGRVVSGLLDQQAFIESAVPVMVVETVKDTRHALENIGQIDFSDLPQVDWFRMSDEEFYEYMLGKNPTITTIETMAVNNLRKKMIRLYTPRVSTAEQFVRGDLIAMPVVTDKNREIKAIIPFFLPGY